MNKINLATGIVFLFLKARGDIFKFVIVGEKIFCLFKRMEPLIDALITFFPNKKLMWKPHNDTFSCTVEMLNRAVMSFKHATKRPAS